MVANIAADAALLAPGAVALGLALRLQPFLLFRRGEIGGSSFALADAEPSLPSSGCRIPQQAGAPGLDPHRSARWRGARLYGQALDDGRRRQAGHRDTLPSRLGRSRGLAQRVQPLD
jgi:hypothetical protein